MITVDMKYSTLVLIGKFHIMKHLGLQALQMFQQPLQAKATVMRMSSSAIHRVPLLQFF